MTPFPYMRLGFLLAALLLIASCAHAPIAPQSFQPGNYEYLNQYMSWFIQQEMKKQDIAGLSIAVVDGDQVVWSKGFGYANRETFEAANANTLYRAGSVSKVFTAIGVMQLVEKGLIDIDKPFADAVSQFKIRSRFGSTANITPRNMMSHHSGLPTMYEGDEWNQPEASFRSLLSKIKEEYIATPPNTVMAYSNLAYSLLGVLIEDVSGRDFSTYMNDSLLRPLAMQHSSFLDGQSEQEVAQGYHYGNAAPEHSSRLNPAGGLVTSVQDLANLVSMVLGQGQFGNALVLKSDTLKSMLTPQNDNVPLDFGKKIGLSWFIYPDSLQSHETIFGHDGATDAHRAYLRVAPQSGLGVVILSNSSQSSDSLPRIGQEALELALEMKSGLPRKPESRSAPKLLRAGTAGTNSLDGDYAGQYGIIRIYSIGAYQYVKVMNHVFSLRKGKDGKFYLLYQLWDVIPMKAPLLANVAVQNELVSGYNLLTGDDGQGKKILGVRLPRTDLSDQWLKRIGTYQMATSASSGASSERVSLVAEDEHLVVKLLFRAGVGSEFALIPISEHEAVKAGLGRGFGESIRFYEENGRQYGVFSGIKIEKLN